MFKKFEMVKKWLAVDSLSTATGAEKKKIY